MQLLLGLCVELDSCVVCAYAEKCEDLRVVFQYTLLSGRVTGNRYQPFDTQMYSDLRPSLENLNMVLLSSMRYYKVLVYCEQLMVGLVPLSVGMV